MAEGKFIAYYRVSTDRQGKSGLGLEAQQKSVTDFLNGGKWQLIASYTEVESGKTNDRPELLKALAACRIHGATLVIAKLDRLSRNAHFLTGLHNAGIKFVAVDMPEANEFIVTIMAALAEQERRMISSRTKAALEAAKARGVKLGGNRGNLEAIRGIGPKVSAKVRSEKAQARASDLAPLMSDLKAQGLSLAAMAERLDSMGIKTARGCQWTPMAVKRVLDRL